MIPVSRVGFKQIHRLVVFVADTDSRSVANVNMNPSTISSGYRTQSPDTSINTELMLFSLWRSLSLVKKIAQISQWTKGCWELSLTSLKHQYPTADYRQLRCAFAQALWNCDIPDIIAQVICHQHRPIVLTDPITVALDIAAILDYLGIPYLIGGSIASAVWGEARATQDIDVVVELANHQIDALLQAVSPRFYASETAIRDAIQHATSFNLIDQESLVKIDLFILTAAPFSQSEFQRRRAYVVREPNQSLVLPTPEDIIIQKLLCYQMNHRQSDNQSDKQWRDVLGVVKLQGLGLDFAYLWHWVIELGLADDFQKICTEAGL